jgi:hypothetical protein
MPINEYYRNLPLTVAQIKDAFPQEIKTLVPRLLTEYRKPVKFQAKIIHDITLRGYDIFTERFLIQCIKVIYYNIDWYNKQVHRLEVIITQQNQSQLNDNRVTDEMIERAKNVPITSVQTFERLKNSGSGRMIACCIFHAEKTPSFVIYLPNKGAHCFSCGWSCQDTISFIQKARGLSFPQAVRLLCAS